MPNFAGLYIGTDFVDLVILSNGKTNLKIIKSLRTFIYDESSLPDQKDKTIAVPIAIKKVFDAIKVNINSVNFGLPQDEVMVRHFKMPYLVEAERSNAVKFEAQKYLPFKVDDTISDFYITQESKQEKSMDALFVAVNKETMGKTASLFRDLGIKLNIVDITPIALLRVLTLCRKVVGEQAAVVVYLERSLRGSIIIVKDKNVYLSREVSSPVSKGVLFENILNNIRLSVDYYKRETKEVIVSEILICGDGELLDLEIYLKENIGTIPIQTFNPTNEIAGLNDLSRKQLIAIGLAMAHLEKPRPKINLLFQISKGVVSKTLLEEYKPLIIEGVTLFLILALLQIFGSINLNFAKKKTAQLKEQKAIIAKGITPDVSQEELLAMEDKIKLQIGFLKLLVEENKFFLTKKLNSLGRLLPEGIWIESFQFTDDIDGGRTLDIKGMIYSKEKNETDIANKIVVDMKNLEDFYFGFEDIKLSSLERVTAYDKEILSFLVKCSGKPLNSSGLFGEKASRQRAPIGYSEIPGF